MIEYKNDLKSVSIGIPVYNEAGNIARLLRSLVEQETDGFAIKEIIAVCDGSTDGSVLRAKEIKDPRIVVIHDGRRLGKSARLSQILQRFSGDILFLLDADITVRDSQIFAKLLSLAKFEEVGLVGVEATPLTGETFFERVVNCGVEVMNEIARSWNGGNNYLSFKGCFLGLDRRLAKAARFDSLLVNNDAYFYFKALELGYSPKKFEDIAVYYRSPATFEDHLKQSSRYRSSKEELQKYFSYDLSDFYSILLLVSVMSTVKVFLRMPVYLLVYIVVRLATKVLRERKVRSTWEIARSTKG